MADSILGWVVLSLQGIRAQLLILEALEVESICKSNVPTPDQKLQDEFVKLNCSQTIVLDTEPVHIEVFIGYDH